MQTILDCNWLELYKVLKCLDTRQYLPMLNLNPECCILVHAWFLFGNLLDFLYSPHTMLRSHQIRNVLWLARHVFVTCTRDHTTHMCTNESKSKWSQATWNIWDSIYIIVHFVQAFMKPTGNLNMLDWKKCLRKNPR